MFNISFIKKTKFNRSEVFEVVLEDGRCKNEMIISLLQEKLVPVHEALGNGRSLVMSAAVAGTRCFSKSIYSNQGSIPPINTE